MSSPVPVTVYHNPACGTSRNTLALIRNAGVEPVVVEYLRTPLDSQALRALLQAMGVPAMALLREKEKRWQELQAASGKPAAEWSEGELVAAMAAHPVLMNRPVVTTPWGTRLCRPSEAVLDILPLPQLASFTKEDGEVVIDAGGQRVR
jgi:arsenate reductase (glutaredoxin)